MVSYIKSIHFPYISNFAAKKIKSLVSVWCTLVSASGVS